MGSCPWPQPFRPEAKALVGAAPIFFGPCTLGRTWGTRPISFGLCYDTGRVNHLGNCKLLFDECRPVGGAGREHGVVEVEFRVVQHRVHFAGAPGA